MHEQRTGMCINIWPRIFYFSCRLKNWRCNFVNHLYNFAKRINSFYSFDIASVKILLCFESRIGFAQYSVTISRNYAAVGRSLVNIIFDLFFTGLTNVDPRSLNMQKVIMRGRRVDQFFNRQQLRNNKPAH